MRVFTLDNTFGYNPGRAGLSFSLADKLAIIQRLDHQQSINTSDDASGHQDFRALRNTGESILSATARYHWSDMLTLESGLSRFVGERVSRDSPQQYYSRGG